MKVTIKGFGTSKKYQDRKVVYCKVNGVDELTGVDTTFTYTFLVVGNFYFTNYINKECELTLVKSPKLGFNVVTDIKLVSKESEPKEDNLVALL